MAYSLTNVLPLLPQNSDPFTLGPRNYLIDLMNLLSVLRNGNDRFLPLLRAKVDDVLPRLVNPMLQTVPDTPMNMCPVDDIFDGFGTAGVGVASNFPGYNGDGTSGAAFKSEPESDFTRSNVQDMPQYEAKRMEEFGSPPGDGNSENNINSPFTGSTGAIQSPSDYPAFNEYSNFSYLNNPAVGSGHPNLPVNGMGNFGDGNRNVQLKTEFDFPNSFALANQIPRPQLTAGPSGPEGMRRQPPQRQNSGSSYHMPFSPQRSNSGSSFGIQPPRSVPEQYNQLQRTTSGEESMMPGINDLPYR